MNIIERTLIGGIWYIRIAINSSETIFVQYPENSLPSDSIILADAQRQIDTKLIQTQSCPVMTIDVVTWNTLIDELTTTQQQIILLQQQIDQLIAASV